MADNGETKVIVTFKGGSYDITDFLRKHPGGNDILVENNGKDIEELMEEMGHSPYAYDLLKQYKINGSS